jgi:uncharacterized protein (DUF1330 family)
MSTRTSLVAGLAFLTLGCASSVPPSTGVALMPDTPTGYILVEITVTDPAGYEGYRQAVAPLIARYGGIYLVRGGQTETLEGNPANRIVVLQFPNVDAARSFYNAPDYRAIIGLRTASATSRLILVEGAGS